MTRSARRLAAGESYHQIAAEIGMSLRAAKWVAKNPPVDLADAEWEQLSKRGSGGPGVIPAIRCTTVRARWPSGRGSRRGRTREPREHAQECASCGGER